MKVGDFRRAVPGLEAGWLTGLFTCMEAVSEFPNQGGQVARKE